MAPPILFRGTVATCAGSGSRRRRRWGARARGVVGGVENHRSPPFVRTPRRRRRARRQTTPLLSAGLLSAEGHHSARLQWHVYIDIITITLLVIIIVIITRHNVLRNSLQDKMNESRRVCYHVTLLRGFLSYYY